MVDMIKPRIWAVMGLLACICLCRDVSCAYGHFEAISGHPRGHDIPVLASWYSVEACQYNSDTKCPTASGYSLYELERRGVSFAAAWEYPLGTWLKITNVANNAHTYVVILDRGPAKRLRRGIDLSRLAFESIADTNDGIITVTIERV